MALPTTTPNPKSKPTISKKANIKNDVTSLKDSNNRNRNKLAQAAEARAVKAAALKPKKFAETTTQSARRKGSISGRAKSKMAQFRIFNKQAAQSQSAAKLPSVWRITGQTVSLLKQNWKLFAGIMVIHALLTVLLVRGLSGTDNIETIKALFGGDVGRLTESFVVFISLMSASSTNPNPVSGLYQSVFAVITSLAIIWALRQVFSGTAKVRIRDAYYKGMYPLVPVVIIMVVISLQLLPFLFGATVYATVNSPGLAVTLLEQILWMGLLFILTLTSLYFLTSSIFGLYIAALPDMTPLQALRSAKELVKYRRWTIMRKVLFLPLLMFIVAAAVMIPVILVITPAAPIVYFILTMFLLPVVHAYMYTLYRELLR